MRPVTAFGSCKQSFRTLNGAKCDFSGQLAYGPRVPVLPLHGTSRRSTRLFSVDQQDAANGSLKRSYSEPKRHAVLELIQESFESLILSHLPDSSSEEVMLLVGVSGGCDSVGLLHALNRVMIRVGDKFHLPNHPSTWFTINVVHFNHKQRGGASDGDAVFVQQLCKELNLPCRVYEWDSADATAFSQDRARQWRRSTMYSLLQSLSSEQHGVILTAHHRDDSEESMLLKMLRGVHLTNLVGMDAVVPGSEDMPNAIIARPMLGIRKADIVDFLESHDLTWREDESNASDKYLRNRVRNELMPLLSDMMGGADVLQVRVCIYEWIAT